MADGGEGFGGRIDVVRQARGYRRWPDELKARIVAESFQPGAQVGEVARRHDVFPHQLSTWRSAARAGRLVLPADAVGHLSSAFVPLSVAEDEVGPTARSSGTLAVELDGGIVIKVPADASVTRAVELIRALRGLR